MSAVEDQIRQAGSRNAELLAVLTQTDYAPSALQQQNSYIKEVEQTVAQNTATLKKLAAQREKEGEDHKKYSESVGRRFLYKATGQKEKFTAKADKEEKEYFEALRAEHHAQQEAQSLATQLEEARQGKAQLDPDVARRQQAQKDLDSLYQSIFAGPTPSFPEEDQQESAVEGALAEYQRFEQMFQTEEQVLGLLARAAKAMTAAQYHVEDALRHSRVDMFGGGLINDMLERSALSNAEVATAELYRVIAQACSLSPNVQQLPQIPIAQGSIMSDVVFDNIFTDMAFHEKIKESLMGLHRAAQVLLSNQSSAQQRRSDLSRQMAHASSRLSNERKTLQMVREQIFERLAQGETAGRNYTAPPPATDSTWDEPPPAYS